MKILWDLKILRETGSRRDKILWDFVSQYEVCHVCLLPAELTQNVEKVKLQY